MQTQRVHTLRQAALKTGRDFAPAPFGLDDLEADPALARHQATREELHAAWRDLLGYGYLALVPESNGALAKITAPGLAQINGDAKRDPAIFGRYAL